MATSNQPGEDESRRYGIIEYFGLTKECGRCGYCKSTRSAGNTYGLWAHILPPRAYQNLIDRNWRRCGKYVYRPVNDKICCPLYTIRCDATQFRLSSSQKKVLKRFNAYILYDRKPEKGRRAPCEPHTGPGERLQLADIPDMDSTDGLMDKVKENWRNKTKKKIVAQHDDPGGEENTSTVTKPDVDPHADPSDTQTPGSLRNTKKKFLRRQKLVAKVMRRNGCSEEEAKKILFVKSQAKQKTKTLEEFLAAVDGKSPEAKHRFRTEIISKSIINEMDKAGYEVFKKYQMNIHKENEEDVSYRSYKRFLLDSPLEYSLMEKRDSSNHQELPLRYGAYHQHYYIDDRLVAVGVIDILPGCVSSVYLFYDPEFAFLDLGVYSALTEIALIRKLATMLPDLRYYYMGYYIHSCPKMRYKARYRPSYLLCPETLCWFDIDTCVSKLNRSKYARFCDDPEIIDEDGAQIQDCDIKLYHRDAIITAGDFLRLTKDRKQWEKMHEFARLVGRKCTNALLYFV